MSSSLLVRLKALRQKTIISLLCFTKFTVESLSAEMAQVLNSVC